MQRWLRHNVIPEDAVYPRTRKDLFRLAAKHRLIDSPDSWFLYGDARNLTSHTYDERKASEVYEAACQFIEDAKYLLNQLQTSND